MLVHPDTQSHAADLHRAVGRWNHGELCQAGLCYLAGRQSAGWNWKKHPEDEPHQPVFARHEVLTTLINTFADANFSYRAIKIAQVVEVLILMAKAFLEAMTRDDTLGLNPYEITFYDALAENESAVHEFGDETLRRAAVEVTRQLRKSTIVDWLVRESIRARLRIGVRQTLRNYKFPPD